MEDLLETEAAASTQSLGKALAILDVFKPENPTWSVEDLCDALGWSVPTAYRYVRELLAVGLLRRLPGSLYALGPRIILLDYIMRQADPVLGPAVPEMRELVRRTGCDCVLTSLFGDVILDTHREIGNHSLPPAFGRGRPRPPLLGAAPKVILANQTTPWLHKFYDTHAVDAAAAGMGTDWKTFRSGIKVVRRRGHYIAHGELAPGISALAMPLAAAEPDAGNAIALVADRDRFALLNEKLLIDLLRQAAERIVVAMHTNRSR